MSLEGDIGPGSVHPDAIHGGATVPVTPSEDDYAALSPEAQKMVRLAYFLEWWGVEVSA